MHKPNHQQRGDCATGAARYVPVFALPDATTLTLASSNTPLIIKALDTEVRLASVSCSSTNIARPDTVATMPSDADLHDPSDSTDNTYIGDKPTVTDTPTVIVGGTLTVISDAPEGQENILDHQCVFDNTQCLSGLSGLVRISGIAW